MPVGKSKSTDYNNIISKSDKSLPEVILNSIPKDENIREIDDKEKKELIVYENGITSVDIMMPEEEKQILENNINVYSDLSKTNKLLNLARNNLKVRQGIKELEQIDKLGEMIDIGSLKLMEMFENVDINSYKQLQNENPEAASKAIKNVAIALNSMMQTKDNKLKSLNGSNSSKKVKIALKFQNDNGSETALGLEAEV